MEAPNLKLLRRKKPRPSTTLNKLDFLGDPLSRLNWAAEVASQIKPTHAVVAIHIAAMVNADHREAWPSIDTLAERAGCSRRTVQRALNELRQIGAINTVERDASKTFRMRLVPRDRWKPKKAAISAP
jgi:biotin operon repressor